MLRLLRLKSILITLALQTLLTTGFTQQRVVIMTDFTPVDVIPGGMGFGSPEKRSDSDDVQSMIRFLLYTNDFDIEGLIATSATFVNIVNKQKYWIFCMYIKIFVLMILVIQLLANFVQKHGKVNLEHGVNRS